MVKIVKACKTCGSYDVVLDADVAWNEVTQAWELDTFDPNGDPYCRPCGDIVEIVDKPLNQEP